MPVSDRMRLRVLATPGHTFHHLSYVLDEHVDGDWRPVGVFTGGSLLYGTTGRPDLLGREHAHTLAAHQHASARRLADLLPDHTRIWPTHGFGSFCSATQVEAEESTIGREKAVNPVLRLPATSSSPGPWPSWMPTRVLRAHGVRNSTGRNRST